MTVKQCHSVTIDLMSITFTTNSQTSNLIQVLFHDLGLSAHKIMEKGFFLILTSKNGKNGEKNLSTKRTLKLCSGSDVNKDANCGVLQKDRDVLP